MSEDAPRLHHDRNRAGSFGEDAEQYDRVRPPYPAELIDRLLSDAPRTVLDVGCGTGIAARLFMARGCEVLGLEPDPRMAAVARRRGVPVEDGSIEEWSAGDRRFDLLTAGQSWHWVDPIVGAAKAAIVLRPGGRFGLFWNQAQPQGEALVAVERAYERHAPDLGRQSVLLGQRDVSIYESIAEAFRADGGFTEVTLEMFGHDQVYPTEMWLELAGTHSDHRALPPEQLEALLASLRRRIDEVGGQVPVRYETTLVTGRSR
jgi:SAM-dependent methyltransferase